jgi:hypothetical protein
MAPDSTIQRSLIALLERWRIEPEKSTPLQDLQDVLEIVRRKSRGEERTRCLNTIVRTLGEPETLATVLDILRLAINKEGTGEQQLAKLSQEGKWHAVYGWCGQTAVVLSREEPTDGTASPTDRGLEEKLGYPPTLWWLSIHIWQPNPKAKGFESGKRPEPNVILEPPHSHPFDFVSMVSIGSMRQSIYSSLGASVERAEGRYAGVLLEHVDGVWPPHDHQDRVALRTVEDQVLLAAGDSYYMPCHRIHDVEIDAGPATHAPTISLFMATETLMVPHVYMAKSMLDYHEAHPAILDDARPLSVEAWQDKLAAVSDYLRGKSSLRLDDIVKTDQEYAFFHV